MNIWETIEKDVRGGFRQQDIWTCGPASINLVLRALGSDVKPEHAWKDSRFSKWVPTEQFPIRGIALHELQFTCEMLFGAEFEFAIRRAYPENFELFAKDIQAADSSGKLAVIVNFRQDDLVNQAPGHQGNPHYSPIAGFRFNETTNETEVLIADVDPEVKEPFWATAKAVFKSMGEINPAFGVPRGWLVMRQRGSCE